MKKIMKLKVFVMGLDDSAQDVKIECFIDVNSAKYTKLITLINNMAFELKWRKK